jgi:hypothetical protein
MARSDLAGQIWPHLAADRPAPREMPRERDPAAAKIYPNLVPKVPKAADRYHEGLLRNLRAINVRKR